MKPFTILYVKCIYIQMLLHRKRFFSKMSKLFIERFLEIPHDQNLGGHFNMYNEILGLVTFIAMFAMMVLMYRFFGKQGLIAWVANWHNHCQHTSD